MTVWLPSDFKGRIHHSGRATYSAGFINRILKNVLLNRDQDEDVVDDHVVVYTRGTISFRMWDAVTCKPENLQKETIKRIFGCGRKKPRDDDGLGFPSGGLTFKLHTPISIANSRFRAIIYSRFEFFTHTLFYFHYATHSSYPPSFCISFPLISSSLAVALFSHYITVYVAPYCI